ncbi:hypothetical protein KNO81_39240 [Paraburkholderia sediminicola]|nr:hypothetical protein [Paraburkholderia sediminicola]
MGELNLSQSEHEALDAIDTDLLTRLIEQCLREVRPDALGGLSLRRCGLYISKTLQNFRQALKVYADAKAPHKRAEMEHRARLAGDDLRAAIQHMKHRAEKEQNEAQLFKVDDMIVPPLRYSQPVFVRVSFQWRKTIDDQWQYGSITFSHTVHLQPDYSLPAPKQKPSAAAQEQERQDKLCRNWEHLKSLGLQSVQEYLQKGGDGAFIQSTFEAKSDTYTCELNNYSAQFWLERGSQVPAA